MRYISFFLKIFLFLLSILPLCVVKANALQVGDKAPLFQARTHKNETFDLSQQKGRWTVLFFYPKAETPGCTRQACAFRDAFEDFQKLKADIYGISSDTVEQQKAFHKNHNLSYDLLADPQAKILSLYGTKMMGLNFSKRWTYIIDDQLIIRHIDQKVDPQNDAKNVLNKIKELQKTKATPL